MWFIGVEVEQETSAPPPKKILDPPLDPVVLKISGVCKHKESKKQINCFSKFKKDSVLCHVITLYNVYVDTATVRF